MASVDRTAYPRFKRTTSARELREAFTPAADEVAWAEEKTTTDQHRLALLVLLKSYQRLGYFPHLAEVPDVVVAHVRGQLGLDESVAAAHDAASTAKRHRGWVRARMGVTHEPAEVRVIAEAALRTAAQVKDNPADLINAALEELVKARCELPGYTTLDVMASTVRTEVNTALFATVAGRLDAAERARVLGLLAVDPATRRSDFDRVKDTPPAATVKKFKKWLDHLAWLDGLGPTARWLDGVTPGKISHFAGEADVLDAAELGDVGEDKRLALLICRVHTARVAARDAAVEMFCKRLAALHKSARDRLDELREQHRADSERLLGVFGDVLAAVREAMAPSENEEQGGPADPVGVVSERTGRLVIKTLAEAGGVAELSQTHEAVTAHHGNNHAPLIAQFYRSHRAAMFTLLDALELEPTSADRTVLDAVAFLKANRHRTGEFIPDHTGGEVVDLSFAGEAWQKILRDRRRPGRLVRRHFEACVFTYLAAELRSGDIAVAGSDSYANLHAQLLSWDDCQPLLADYCAQAGIPATAGEFTTWLKDELTRVAAAVDDGYPANADLAIDEASGVPVLKARRGRERRASALALEDVIHARLPERSLLDILTRTAHLLGWHRHFGPASGSDPKLANPLARYSLMTFTYGTNLGPAQVARHLRGKVSAHELSTAGNKHVTGHKLHLASADVVNAFSLLDMAGLWGDGSTAGTDGSQVDTWENNLLAETSVRYGGYGGIAYRHIADTYIALFSRFIPCGVWEAIYIIDGLLRNASEVSPDVVHADTQGQSLPVFGLATLLGFELLPRIRNWKDLVFYRPDPGVRYTHIDALFGDQAIDWRLIENHWPDLVRTSISIREGALSSVTLLRRLGHDSRKNRLYRAFRELGRAVRTLVLLRYLSEPGLRDSIAVMTNKVEGFHGFAQWLLFGGEVIGHNDPDYQEKIVKFNELIANCAIYQTTLDITEAANQLVAEGWVIDPADLATVTPYIRHNIRRFGEWVLDTTPPDPAVATHLDVPLAS